MSDATTEQAEVEQVAHTLWSHMGAQFCGSPLCRYADGEGEGDYECNCPRCWSECLRMAEAVVKERNEALREAGLLAPAPLREDGVGWYEVIHPSRATTHIAYVHEDGSIYFPEGTQVLDSHEFTFAAARGLAHRLVRADAVDRAEGDGRTEG